jgi:hypothetical protein
MFLIFNACSLALPPSDVDCKNRIHAITNLNAANLNVRSVACLGSSETDPLPPFRGHYGRQSDVWWFMTAIDVLGIDPARLIIQLHGADRRGRALHPARVSRGSLFGAVRTLKLKLIVMEACVWLTAWINVSSHLEQAACLSPQYVVLFVDTNKDERSDVEAIVEAARHLTMHFVPIKSIEQKSI